MANLTVIFTVKMATFYIVKWPKYSENTVDSAKVHIDCILAESIVIQPLYNVSGLIKRKVLKGSELVID